MKMRLLEYTVTFHTPAFLGNAEQVGQWRTPPFKAQLRQWWRVAYAARCGFKVNIEAMRREEGSLFGHAWLEDDRDKEGNKVAARKSAVRMRLDRWGEGALKKEQWPKDSAVTHPEVKNKEGKPVPVGSALYLGYGPLEFRNGTALKKNAAIQQGEKAIFSVAAPDADATLLEYALCLMDLFGAVGGRSRNGWGSYSLTANHGDVAPTSDVAVHRPWKEALTLDWPHAIGKDDSALIWQTGAFDDWKALMKQLATIKIGMRTQFTFSTGRDAIRVEDRHWLSYPVTNHSVKDWGGNARLPNSLRFKVRPAPDAPGKLVGIVFHMPCLPPPQFRPDRNAIESVWQQVHGFLDAPAQQLTRIPA